MATIQQNLGNQVFYDPDTSQLKTRSGFVITVSGGMTEADVLAMGVVREDIENRLIDSEGNVISGSWTVADLDSLMALSAATFEGFAIMVLTDGSFWTSNGTYWKPLNGDHNNYRSNVRFSKITLPNSGLTWTASATGANTLVTSNAAHGLTSPTSVGSSLQSNSTQNGWIDKNNYEIVSIPSTTTVELLTPHTGKGIPTFALSNQEITMYSFTSQKMRNNTVIEINPLIVASDTVSSKRCRLYFGGSLFYDTNVVANLAIPLEWDIANRGATNVNMGLKGVNSNNILSNAAPFFGTVETNAGVACEIRMLVNTPNVPVSLEALEINYKN